MAGKSLGEQWREYGDRPPIARWTARVSLIVGTAIGVALVVGCVGTAIWAVVRLLRALL